MTGDKPFDSDIRLMLNLGTIGIIFGTGLFVWGSRYVYLYASQNTAVEFPAMLGMMGLLFAGFLLTTVSTSVCISAVEEQTQINIIRRNIEREANSNSI